MVAMYVRALAPRFDLVLVTPDAEEAGTGYPEVKVTVIAPSDCTGLWHTLSLLVWLMLLPFRITRRLVPRLGERLKWLENTLGYVGRMLLWNVGQIRAVTRARSDLVIAIDGDSLLSAIFLRVRRRVPFVYAVYEIWPDQFLETPKLLRNVLAKIERIALQKAARAFVFHPRVATYLARHYRVLAQKFRTIYTCPPVPEECSSAAAGVPLRIYYHGVLCADRGLELLIRAMRHVDGASLSIRGFGPLEDSLRRLVVAENLANKVFFLEPVDSLSLSPAATKFDIGVITATKSTRNGRFVTGFKLFENMAAGLAIIAPKSHVLRSFIRNNPVGLNYGFDDEASLASAIQYCVENPSCVEGWKRNARGLAEASYNAEVQGSRLREQVGMLLEEVEAGA